MHLVEILLPLADNEGRPFDRTLFAGVREALLERFGGLTAFARAPAEGLWEDEAGGRARDEIMVLEVMADEVDRGWWARFRQRLERDFAQDEIVVRARTVERL